ncbi:MAG: outer membrane lipoprotein-sorting protein [Gammaproteobacteria bacterium]|nr:outer membrane lipoprotein-sorting protein [Gammaproteobacteria bacterium]MCP5136793.1 outer membrane lipoprotein-sorting protein [Gammaproteobacteria bacterium]
MKSWLWLLVGLWPAFASGNDEAAELLKRVRAQHSADVVVSRYEIEIVRTEWQRTVIMAVTEDQRGGRYQGMVIAPRRLADTLYLKRDGRLWMVIPRLRRKVGISPAMLSEPWMGSDLSNQDILQGDAVIDDYQHRVIARDGDLVTIESTPLPGRPALWRRLRQQVRRDAVPVRVDYFDQDDVLQRRIEFSEVGEVGERRLPMVWRIVPMPEKGEYTLLKVSGVEFDPTLPDDAFNALEQATAGTATSP